MKLKLKESDIQKTIIAYLATRGWYVLRINSGAIPMPKGHMIRMAPAGTPDIIACSPTGRFVGIEVKVPGKVPTEVQHQTLQEINRVGGVGMWVSSVEEMVSDLKGIGLLT